jgi:uncharacterized protein with GYD domain
MSAYMLLCNFTDQGVRTIKEVPQRRAAAREFGKELGVDIKAGYLAMGTYDLIIHTEATDDEAMANCRWPPWGTCGRPRSRCSRKRMLTRSSRG